MRPSADTAIDFGPEQDPSPPSSDFEHVQYPNESLAQASSTASPYTNTNSSAYHHQPYQAQYHPHQQSQATELPLHYTSTGMSEETARRRVVGTAGAGARGDQYNEKQALFDAGSGEYGAGYDDGDGKTKPLPPHVQMRNRVIGSGRLPQRHATPPASIGEFISQNLTHLAPIVYTLLSCYTRFHAIGKSDIVVWDEAHFGKFGSYYIKREFYFDVHPPLGKMLVGLAGLLSGYDGSFEFKSGEKYPENVPFVAMRVMLATFGVMMVPLGWYTAVELGMTSWACHLVALMVLCDVAWLCISRFILLDSMLLFFTFLTVFCLTKFHNQQWQPFSVDWWLWLSMTGFSIGCVTSVKMIGLFVTALVGVYTIEDLWEKFGDLKMPVRDQAKHWAARIGCLIVLPVLVFMASFKLHFMILNRSGTGDAQMSSLFQANLIGNDFATNPLEIAYGSKVTLKNMGWGGGLLHSHIQTYPVGSNQQQVTCYHYKDNNNDWVVHPSWDRPSFDPEAPLSFLAHGDVIRLVHDATTRNLHSHTIPAPVSKLNNEVSCYGNITVGDRHDHWVVEVVDDVKRGSRDKVDKIHSLTTRLRFKHQMLGCYLRAANAILPQWGFKQVEVSCVKENDAKDVHTYWNVESHWNDRLPKGQTKFYRSPFLRDFWHLNVAMMTSNNALIPDPDKEDILASKPLDWPFLHLGLRMCGWADTQIKYYLLGTPIIYWSGSVSLIVGLLTLAWYLVRHQRKYVDMDPREWDHFLYVGKIAFFGWFFHYAPFLVMGRVTYVHHYLPTLYFAVLMAAHMIDHFVFSSRRFSKQTKQIVFGVVAGSIVGMFWWFRGMAFGIEGPINEHWGLGWRKSWNIYTN